MDAAQKSFQIQSQIRHNAEELKNTLNDLYSWEKEIKDKELELQRQPVGGVSTTGVVGMSKSQNDTEAPPPVRSQVLKENVQNSKNIGESVTESANISKLPNSKKAETPTEKIEMPTDPNEEKRKQANAIKDRGNEFVKLKQYVEAIKEYTEAIDIYPENAAFYTNRALCYLKLQKYYDCIDDCERALEIDIRSVKAYYRRMQANENLGNDIDAFKDCQTILAMDAKNVDAKNSLERISRSLTSRINSKTGPSFSHVRSDMCFIEPVDKPPYARSSKPLRRIYITDVVGPKDCKNKENANLQVSDDVIDKLFNSYCGPFVEVKKELPSEEPTPSILTTTQTRTTLTKAPKTLVNHHHQKTATERIEKTLENHVEAKKPKKVTDKEQAKDKQTTTGNNGFKTTIDEKSFQDGCILQTDNALEEEPLASLFAAPERPLPPAPTCTAQFYSNWKELTPSQKYQYLKSIDNAKLCKMLGAGFDSDTLTDVIKTLRDFYMPQKDPDLAVALLEVSRNTQVAILSLLMSTNDRKALSEILNSLKESNEDTAVVTLIATNFNLH